MVTVSALMEGAVIWTSFAPVNVTVVPEILICSPFAPGSTLFAETVLSTYGWQAPVVCMLQPTSTVPFGLESIRLTWVEASTRFGTNDSEAEDPAGST